ncbi:DUF3892 domain-containing protein [Methanomassiliicoccus luminyensis]|uniref:DUF3892 domain-containing protein n=1 Tax=Methanomassiliicoccus luminyensis TaxID=1080712 RepID=UPI00037732CB|nr:DUF3892 domain-containing protein [Methanomassiliicoccus luminyensis]
MSDYQVDGTVREKVCDSDSPITHLKTASPDNKIYSSAWVISRIKSGDKFWSYVYRGRQVVTYTRVEVEVINDARRGEYLRTRGDRFDENNLLELPTYYLGNDNYYHPCP